MEIFLIRQNRIRIRHLIIPALRIHIIHHSNRQQIQIPYAQSQLYAPEQEQRRCHRAVCRAKFFSLVKFEI